MSILTLEIGSDEIATELASTFNASRPKFAFAKNKAVKLLKSPIKELSLLVNPHEFLKGFFRNYIQSLL